jgi:AraC-like DNA-binding protein
METGHNVVLEEGRLGYAEPGLRPQPAADDFSQRFPDGIAATGRGKRLALREGLDLTCIDFQMQDVCTSTGSSKGTQLSIHILLDAAGHGWVADADGVPLGEPIAYRPGLTYLCFFEREVAGTYQVPVGARFKLVELRLQFDFLQKLGVLEKCRALGEAHPLCKTMGDRYWIGLMLTRPAVQRAATQLLDLVLGEEASDLAIEAHALEVLSQVLPVIGDAAADASYAPREVARLLTARDLLLAKLDHAWSIRELSLKVGLNEKKLKAGFREQFGSPIYAFLQRARLDRARTLIEGGSLSVTEAAFQVGYSNPSHFARLFRREFGIAPSSALGSGSSEI